MIQMNLSTENKLMDLENKLVVARAGVEWDGLGVWGQQMQTITFGVDKQSPTVQHRELYPVTCDGT